MVEYDYYYILVYAQIKMLLLVVLLTGVSNPDPVIFREYDMNPDFKVSTIPNQISVQ